MFEQLEDTPTATQEKPIYEQFMDWVESRALDNTTTDPTQYTNRFMDALPMHKLREKSIVVIGAGGIGSPTVKNLVAMGAKQVTVIDDDIVEPQNIGTQYHRAVDLGRPKVDALRDSLLTQYMTEIYTIQARVESYEHLMKLVNYTHIDILIGAVDNMEFRNRIGRELNAWVMEGEMPSGSELRYGEYGPGVYIDARMSLGLWNVFTLPLSWMVVDREMPARDSLMTKYKAQALFPPEEGMQEPCTARALGYTGENIASYIAALVDFVLRANFDSGRSLDARDRAHLFTKFVSETVQRSDELPFKWHTGFDVRSFITTDMNPFLEKTKATLFETRAELVEVQKRYTRHREILEELRAIVPPPMTKDSWTVRTEDRSPRELSADRFYMQTAGIIYELKEGMQLQFIVEDAHTNTLELITETVTELKNTPVGEHRNGIGPDGKCVGQIKLDPGLVSARYGFVEPNIIGMVNVMGAMFTGYEAQSEENEGLGLSMHIRSAATLMSIREPEEAETTPRPRVQTQTIQKINVVGDMVVHLGAILRLRGLAGRFVLTEVLVDRVKCDCLDSEVPFTVDFYSQEEFEEKVVGILAQGDEPRQVEVLQYSSTESNFEDHARVIDMRAAVPNRYRADSGDVADEEDVADEDDEDYWDEEDEDADQDPNATEVFS